MKNLTLVFTLTFSSINVFGCSCAPIRNLQERQQQAYEDNNLIFVGMVITENREENTYTMEINELLKGDYPDTLIIGQTQLNGCSIWPEMGVPWLVYTNVRKDQKIHIEQCSLSRSFEFPYLMHDTASVPPPPPKSIYYNNKPADWMIDLAIKGTAYRRRALILMQEEVEKIRKGY